MPLPGSNVRYNVPGLFLQNSPARAGVDAGSWEHYPSRVARVPFVFSVNWFVVFELLCFPEPGVPENTEPGDRWREEAVPLARALKRVKAVLLAVRTCAEVTMDAEDPLSG